MKFICIEGCDYNSFPLGGTLTFAKHLIASYGSEVALVGSVDENEPVGIWFDREINGVIYKYFGICNVDQIKNTKIPRRILTAYYLAKYCKKINTFPVKRIFTQSPHLVFVLRYFKWESFCFCFAGLGNSVALSKFKFARIFGVIYENTLFRYLEKHADLILAAADNHAINEKSNQFAIDNELIKQFPTRFDEKIFYPKDKNTVREKLGLSDDQIIFVTAGRLSEVKGWKLMIDSIAILKSEIDKLKFIMIGDGEDKQCILDYIESNNLDDVVHLVGRKQPDIVCEYLNASDLFIMGSITEGWSTSLVEAISSGRKAVVTNFSSASEMIIDNKNGFVVKSRDPREFSSRCLDALDIQGGETFSLNLAEKYKSNTLKFDLDKIWNDDKIIKEFS